MGQFNRKISLLILVSEVLFGSVSGGLLGDPTRDDNTEGDGDIQVGQVAVKNATLYLFENWVVNPLNFSRTSETIIDETGGGSEYCYLDPERGERCGSRRRRRWYFSQRNGRCKRFIYLGCGGNENNFRSRRECQRECSEGGRGNAYGGSGSAEGDWTGRRDYRRRGRRLGYRRRGDRRRADEYDDSYYYYD